MDLKGLFVDETNRIKEELQWPFDLSWLTKSYLEGVECESLIAVFTRVMNHSMDLPLEKIEENFKLLKDWIDATKERKYSEKLKVKYDPRLYYTTKELDIAMAEAFEKELNKKQTPEEELDPNVMNSLLQAMMGGKMPSSPKPRPHQYAKRKKRR